MYCRGKEEVITIWSGGVGYLDVECLAYKDGLLKRFALLSVSMDPTVLIFSIMFISSTTCQQNREKKEKKGKLQHIRGEMSFKVLKWQTSCSWQLVLMLCQTAFHHWVWWVILNALNNLKLLSRVGKHAWLLKKQICSVKPSSNCWSWSFLVCPHVICQPWRVMLFYSHVKRQPQKWPLSIAYKCRYCFSSKNVYYLKHLIM